jgi:hypothetical protein
VPAHYLRLCNRPRWFRGGGRRWLDWQAPVRADAPRLPSLGPLCGRELKQQFVLKLTKRHVGPFEFGAGRAKHSDAGQEVDLDAQGTEAFRRGHGQNVVR